MDLENPTNSDPSHPESIAEIISHTMAPEYRIEKRSKPCMVPKKRSAA